MERSFNQVNNIEEDLFGNREQNNFSSFLEILIRRKKLFILFGIAFFLITTSNLLYRRLRNPIYQGSFTIMISDPFINNRTQDDSIESLALNKEILDIPTLVQYLKSPGVVSNVAENNGIFH